MLPRPVPGETEPEPENPKPFDWSIAADSVAFRDGEIHFQDHTVSGASPRLEAAARLAAGPNAARSCGRSAVSSSTTSTT